MNYLFSHNDLDGIGCGILAKLAFGDNVEVRYNSISKFNDHLIEFLKKFNKNNTLYITDISPNETAASKLDELHKRNIKVKLIDHHKSALHLNALPWADITIEEDGKLASATSLLYKFLIQENLIHESNALNEFVELVRLYDTWEWEKADVKKAKQLNDLFSMLSIEEFEQSMLKRLTEEDSFQFLQFEEKLLQVEEEQIQRYIRKKKREIVQAEIGKLHVGIVHAESYHSELGNELGKTFAYLDYIAILNAGSKRISFRTIHDHIDVSEVAGQYGGGGHAKASGCTMTEIAFKDYVLRAYEGESIKADPDKNNHNIRESTKGTLFQDIKETKYMVSSSQHAWEITINGKKTEESFSSFQEAEYFLKRQHSAWLSRDEDYLNFLSQQNIRIE